ncbi:MAG: ABC transporter permease [Gemmatimonadota bacterium]|nr:ABC transporter permease [Gemmatimonadota bacterium]
MARVDMRKLGVVFRREYLERVRSKWFLIGTLLGPVFFGMVTILPTYLSMKQRPGDDLTNIVIVDATGTGLGARVSTELGKTFPAAPAPAVKVLPPERLAVTRDSLVNAVVRKEITGFLVLDSNTVANKSLTYAGRNAGSISDVTALLSKVKQQVLAQRLEHEGLDAARVTALTSEKLETITQKIGSKGLEGGSGMGNLAFGYIVAFLLYMMIVLYGQNILRGVMEEKTTRVAEVVLSSVSPDTLLAGKVLGVGLVAITQVLSWVALTLGMLFYVGPMLFSGAKASAATAAASAGAAGGASSGMPMGAITSALPTPGAALVILAYFVLGFIFYSALFAAVGAMVSSQEDVQQASMPVMLMLISSVIFMAPILTNPGSPLARTMTLLPFSAPILMPLRMSLVTVPWYELAGSLGGVAIACLVSIWLSARIYRVGLLMYGKRPSFRELARWVRYAG